MRTKPAGWFGWQGTLVALFMGMLLALTGCETSDVGDSGAGASSAASTALNRQIEAFNKNRPDGVMAIRQRVLRVSYDRLSDKVTCYDASGTAFLLLHRQSDGKFKGSLDVPYETWSTSDPTRPHPTVTAEFSLARGY